MSKIYNTTMNSDWETPFSSSDYNPELNGTEYLHVQLITIYPNIMGILLWLCELGRVNITHKDSILSQYMIQPRSDHLSQVLNVFNYLKKCESKGWMVFDPYEFNIEWMPFRNDECPTSERADALSKFYPDSFYEIPLNVRRSLGRGVNINCLVDYDHAGNKIPEDLILMLWYSLTWILLCGIVEERIQLKRQYMVTNF